MVFQIMLYRVDLGYFLLFVARMFVLAIFVFQLLVCYVLDNSDSYSRLSNDVDHAIWLLFPIILVLVLLPIVINYFNNCAYAHNFNIII
jgi:hypothetical protein